MKTVELVARAEKNDDGSITVFAPRPGFYRDAPAEGSLVRPGVSIGELEVLGALLTLKAPKLAFGLVVQPPTDRLFARAPVDFQTPLFRLSPEDAAGAHQHAESSREEEDVDAGSYRTTLGGRYYARPAPDRDPFVRIGDVLRGGETVALIEVMKTFNRLNYDGPPVRVAKLLAVDGEDVEVGDVLFLTEEDGG